MHQIAIEEFCRRLGTSAERGLDPAEAARRLQKEGPNSLIQHKREGELVKFFKQMTNLFALLLWIGAGLSFAAEWLQPGQGNIFIAIALVGVVLMNGTFSYFQQHKAEQIMASFRDMLPQMAKVIRGGELRQIPAAELVRGDLILVEEGDQVPADARLVEVSELKVNNASLTGESEPQLRTTYPTDKHLLESRNAVFSGTMAQSGQGRALVFATGMKTQIGRAADLTQAVSVREIPIRNEIRHFTRIISLIAVVMGCGVFIVSLFILQNPLLSKLIFAIGIIVANVPEGLLPTVTLSLSIAARRMAENKALVKNLESVETLGCTTVICTDKTGTLTCNSMEVKRLFLNECIHTEVDTELEKEELEKFLLVASLCNNAHLKQDEGSGYLGDPTEGALLAFCRKFHDVTSLQQSCPRLYEEPFTAATKMMMTINNVAGKQLACLKGAPDLAIALCDSILINGSPQPLTESHRKAYLAAYEEFAGKGERVLLLAYREVETRETWTNGDLPKDGFIFIGLVGMFDPPRPGVADAVRAIRTAGVRIIMLTGDYQTTALAIGRMIGIVTIDNPKLILGKELRDMGDAMLDWELEEKEVIFARLSPEQKLRIVQALQRHGHVVAVTGDGVNDAPALKQADIGVAMGLSGTDVAREAADMVLLDDNFATLLPAIKEGRTIFENLKKSIAYTVTHAVPEVVPYLAFLLFGIPLPLTVMLILSIDLGTDMLPAIALASERSERDIMQLPPRSRSERLVNARLIFLAYGFKGTIEAAAGFYAYFTVLLAGGWHYGTPLPAETELYRRGIAAFFAAIVLCQLANVLAGRVQRQSLLQQGFFSNTRLWLGIFFTLVLALSIIELPPLHLLFGTASLPVGDLLIAWPFAVAILLLDELRRWLIRRNVRWVIRLTAG
ncbi:HAD-IC family P-type ATPase [Geotalea sp. SG265]|uniref:cation-translocating P-type ATPase n=1 Tax=Geotalea sp. SG265 TaxID=2922867 RepID=UPI001FAF36AC|nr:HAD-IC family P-type ATPase [Geotalea sp. SG265]